MDTETKKKILKKAYLLEQGKEISLAKEFISLDDKITNVDSKLSDLSEGLKKKLEEELVYDINPDDIRGEKGKDGVDGINGLDGKDGANGNDGKDGIDGKNGIDGINGIDGKDGVDGKDGSPDTPKDIKDKLETLKGDKRLDKSAIKGLDTIIEKSHLDSAISILDQRTQFLINKKTSDASGDMLKSVYDPANGARQVAFADDVLKLDQTTPQTTVGIFTFPTIKSSSYLDLNGNNPFVLQNNGKIYYTTSWINTGAVSTSGASVTGIGTSFTSSMVGSKIIINNEERIIATYVSATSITVNTSFSQNYSGQSFSVYARALDLSSDGVSVNLYSGAQSGGAPAGTRILGYGGGYLTNTYGFLVGSNKALYSDYFLNIWKDYSFTWSNGNSYGDTRDLGIRRNSAGILEINNGTAGTYRDLILRGLTADDLKLSGSFLPGGLPGNSGEFLISQGNGLAPQWTTLNIDDTLTGSGTSESPLSVKLNWIDYATRWAVEPTLLLSEETYDVYRYSPFEGGFYYRKVPTNYYDPFYDAFYQDQDLTILLSKRATNSNVE